METAETTETIPPTTTQVVARCADLVAEQFVLPDTGERAAALLRSRSAAGAYDDLDPASLAEALSADLHDVAHDLHLRVIHHPEGVPPTDDPEALEAYWNRMARSTAGGMRRVERLPGNVAHVVIGPVLTPATPSWDAVCAAMALVADADALVLDVRECRGGDPDTVQLLMSHVVGDEPVRLSTWSHAPTGCASVGPTRSTRTASDPTSRSSCSPRAPPSPVARRSPSTCRTSIGAGWSASAPAAGPTRARGSRCTPSSSSPCRWPGRSAPAPGRRGRGSASPPTSSALPTRPSTGPSPCSGARERHPRIVGDLGAGP